MKKTIEQIQSANSLPDKLFGLLKQSNSRYLLFKTRFGVHTFFLKEPIDIVVLNNNFQIAYYKKNLEPNRIFFWNPRYKWVLEMPQGSIERFKLQINDFIEFPASPKKS